MTIALTPEVERALAEKARQQGTTPDLLADAFLREALFSADHSGDIPGVEEEKRPVNTAPRNLAERLRGYVGVLHSSENVPGGAQMSERTGRQFTEILLRRREQGRL